MSLFKLLRSYNFKATLVRDINHVEGEEIKGHKLFNRIESNSDNIVYDIRILVQGQSTNDFPLLCTLSVPKYRVKQVIYDMIDKHRNRNNITIFIAERETEKLRS